MNLRSLVSTVLVFFLLSGCTSELSSDDTPEEREQNYSTELTTEDDSWIPEGFNKWDENVVWKWVDRDADCTECVYWHIQILSKNGCPSGVYASINISRNDEVIDWTNDSIPYLSAGQKAVLAFEKYSLSGSGSNYEGELTELNCR
jgi:hypothetical protein